MPSQPFQYVSKRNTLKTSTMVLACALSATLVLAGCGNKDTPTNTKIAKIEKIETRKVDNAEAVQALTLLSLNQSGSGAVTWAGRTGGAGNYTFSGVVVENDDDDTDIKIDQVEIWGTHMDGEQASFDKIEFKDFTAHNNDSDKNVSIGHVSLVKPSPALAAGLAKMFNGEKDAFDDLTDEINGDTGFQALSFTNMKASDDDFSFSLKSLAMGEVNNKTGNKTGDKTGIFSLSGFELDAEGDDIGKDKDKEGKDRLKVSLSSIEIAGINLDKYKGIMAAPGRKNGSNGKETFANIMDTMNIYDPDFKSANLQGLDINAGGLIVTLKSYVANASKKNGIVTMSQKMSPLSIIPPKDGGSFGQEKFSKTLSTMGYDRFEFTMGGKSILDEAADSLKTHDTYIELRDGFRLSYDLDISGYKEFTKQAAALRSGGKSPRNPMAAIGMANAVKIGHIRIALRDDSIVERYLKVAAEQGDTTPEALKNKLKETLGLLSMGAQDEAQQKLADQLKDAVPTFLDGNRTLVFEMNPSKPVNPGTTAMGAMMGGLPDFEKLGITISTQ